MAVKLFVQDLLLVNVSKGITHRLEKCPVRKKKLYFLQTNEVLSFICGLHVWANQHILRFWTFPCHLSGRESIDPYTISVSPGFGTLGRSSSLRYSVLHSSFSKSHLEADASAPLLPDYGIHHHKEDYARISRFLSSFSAKSSICRQPTGELPISHGCSFIQTVFNGKW